ncbi:unnamed protein product, partial [Symbiodinium necroappetens]
ATWRLEASDVADTLNGERILSPQLQLWRHSFRIEVFPHGYDAESEGYFSVFMYVAVEALIDIHLAGMTQRADVTEEMLLKSTRNGTGSWGWPKFCRVSDLTNPIEVRVHFNHIEGKDAKLLSEEAEVLRRKPTETIKIQALWRGFQTRRREELRRAEEQRRRRQSRELTAALRLQLAWRLYQRRLQRRWHSKMLQAQSAPYDAILAFESLSQFLSTGEIRFLQHAESKLQVASAARFRIVAVVGLFDKGKTFLINKLFGVNLPSGKLHTTKGLSFLWIEERRMLVLDSAGVQSTVSYRAQAVQDAILDAQTTESLMFEMISRIAHHMIFVVNDLTWFEQKYVAMLHQKYVQGGQQKELVVVHNLRNTTEVQEACKLLSRQVTRCYDGEQSHLGELIFTQDAGAGAPPLHHIGLCYEFSKAGDAFNEKNRQHLLQSLEHRNSLGSELVLANILTAELARLLPRFVNIEAKCPESSVCSPDQAIGVEFSDAREPTPDECLMAGYKCVGVLRMNLAQEGARVAMKTRGVISLLGEIIAHDVSFDPIVNVYDRTTTHGTSRIIRIECPGVTEEDVEWEELPNGVKISVDKKRPIDEHAVQPVQPIRQHHGVWEQEFSFDYSEGRFELSPEEATFENGVLTVVLKKAAQPRRGKFGQAGDKGCSHLVAPHADAVLLWRSIFLNVLAGFVKDSSAGVRWGADADRGFSDIGLFRMSAASEYKVTWRLEAAHVADKKKGEQLSSQELQLWGHRFQLVLYPRGSNFASEGFSSLCIRPQSTTMDLDLDVAGTSRHLDITQRVLKQIETKTFKDWEFSDFCMVPDFTDPLEVRARFRHIDGKDAKVFAEEAEVRCRKFSEAATTIQAWWRGFQTRRREAHRRAEEQRRRRHSRELTAALCLQLAWRLYQRRLQRRWHSKMVQAQSTPYDAILAFESLSQFLSTGEIRFLQHAESKLQVASAMRFRIVAVVGLFDKGKTFLINKLFGVNLPSGKLHTTKGLSFLWIEERRMLVLDSAGVQSTVSYRAQAVQDAILDAQTTESLMFEMISRIAHHMIFVVNDLTWFEQKYVAMLHQKYVQGGHQKELVVVHNLRNTTDIQEACKLFSRQVTRCYDGQQSHLGELIFTQDAGTGAPPLHHVGLCYEFSKAGDAFNEKNRQHLLQSLEHRNSLGSELVLADILKAELARLLPRFVNIEAKCPESSVCSPDQAIGVEFCDAKGPTADECLKAGYSCVGVLRVNLAQEGARVAMKTRGVISPLGEIIAHDVSFDPIVNVYDRPTTHGSSRIIRIECPGVTEEDVEWEELPNGVKISVDK